MRLKVIGRAIGFLVLLIGATMIFSLLWSLYYHDGDFKGILISLVISISVGLISLLIWEPSEDITKKEAFGIVTFGWIVSIIFGALPFLLTGTIPNFIDAAFESMSGFTTTGASILTDIESLPRGVLFWRSFTHWLGGMGIVVFFIAVLPFLGVGAHQLFRAEVAGPTTDKIKPRVKETAKILLGVYSIITLAETIMLLLGGMNLFDALCHTFGTIATGGFSTKNNSIEYFHSGYIEYVITFFMIIAGTNFTLHYYALKGDLSRYWKSAEFIFYLSLIGIATSITFITNSIENYGFNETSFRYTIFNVVSILTTTGFSTVDFELWSPFAQLILFSLMFFGASSGSTSGSIKNIRIMVVLKHSINEVRKLLFPNAIMSIRISGLSISETVIKNILGFFVLYIFTFMTTALIVSALGNDWITSLTASATTLGGIGPGFGKIGPTDNYSHFSGIAKIVLSLNMLLGRLELNTVLVLLSRSFWKKY